VLIVFLLTPYLAQPKYSTAAPQQCFDSNSSSSSQWRGKHFDLGHRDPFPSSHEVIASGEGDSRAVSGALAEGFLKRELHSCSYFDDFV